MIKRRHFLIPVVSLFLTSVVHAQPIIVDESEELALVDAQTAAIESIEPSNQDMLDSYNEAFEETPLVQESQVKNEGQQSGNNALLLDQLHTLQQEIQELRGQLEVQAHDLKLLQQQQISFYKDLDTRLRDANTVENKSVDEEKEAAIKTNPISKSTAKNLKANLADEQISYLAAYELIKNKQYDEAMTAMQAFITQYPEGGYTANAEYWLGELYMVQKNYPKAIEHFETVLQNHPTSSKTSASLLKLGYALEASGHMTEAKQRLQQVVKNYPDTNAAQLANSKLQSLNL